MHCQDRNSIATWLLLSQSPNKAVLGARSTDTMANPANCTSLLVGLAQGLEVLRDRVCSSLAKARVRRGKCDCLKIHLHTRPIHINVFLEKQCPRGNGFLRHRTVVNNTELHIVSYSNRSLCFSTPLLLVCHAAS